MKHSHARQSGKSIIRPIRGVIIAALVPALFACNGSGSTVSRDASLATDGGGGTDAALSTAPGASLALPDAPVGTKDAARVVDSMSPGPDAAVFADTAVLVKTDARVPDAKVSPQVDASTDTASLPVVDASAVDTMPSPIDTTPGTVVTQGAVQFASFGGWFEAGYATWNPVAGADGYKAYFKKAADSAWTAVDAPLLRGTRVDVPGLAGKVAYQLKVVPTAAGSEVPAQASVVAITPLSHDRSGFAFLPSSPNGNANGGYNPDGTPKATAEILYISEETKDNVELAVTKGKTTTTYKGLGPIMAARQSAQAETPLIVRILGKVTAPAGVDSLALLNIKTNTHVTVEGVGTDALLYAWGLNIRAASDIEVRNLAFSMFTDDSVSIQVDNTNVWIHHNDFMTGTGTGDKELGDGSCDIKDNSSYITVSYNHFVGTGKSSLVGMNDSAEFFVTFHHNYFDNSHSRHPRARWGSVHVYNNYFKGMTTYGAAASEFSNLFVQNNTFENCVRPMIIASQGHDFKDLVPAGNTPGAHESILSSEQGGAIKQTGNVLDAVSQSWFDPAVDTGNGSSGAYNNFDGRFAATSYPCALDSAADAIPKIVGFAGRLNH